LSGEHTKQNKVQMYSPTQHAAALFVVLSFLFLAGLPRAQASCQLLEPPQPGNTDYEFEGYCGYYKPVNQSVYIHPNESQSEVKANIVATLNQIVPLSLTCQSASIRFLCLAMLSENEEYFSLPKPVCLSECELYVASCAASLAYIGQESLLPNCSGTILASEGILGGQPVFPAQSWNYSGIIVNCTSANYNEQVQPVCAPGYSPNPYEDVPLACLPSCPLAYYTDAQWEAEYYIYTLFGLFTVISGIFVLPPYLFTPTKWKWPQQMNTWIMFTSVMTTMPFVFPLIFNGNDWRSVVCQNDVSGSTQTSNSICTIQALFNVYFANAGQLWWLFLAVKAAFLVNGFKTHLWGEIAFAHIFCWGYPFIPLIILTSSSKLGATSLPICVYLVAGEGDNSWWLQSCLLIPSAIILLVGSTFMFILLFTLIKYEGAKGLRKKGRLIVYLMSFVMAEVYIQFYSYITQTHDSPTSGITNWFTCLATYYATAPCQDLKVAPSYVASIFDALISSSIPFSYLLIFGLKGSVFRWWWNLTKGIFGCDWKNVPHWWSDISTSQTSQTSRSSMAS